MEILQYIAELIQSQKEVGIIGLGTIFKKKSPGRYDTATQSFLPPSYRVAFKTELTEQELLRTRLVSRNNLSEEEALEAVASFVAEIKQQLSDYGKADFQPIGTLTLTDGQIGIDVQENFIPGLDFFGLPKFESEAFTESADLSEPEPIMQVEEVNNTPENESIAEPDSEPDVEPAQEIITVPEKEPEIEVVPEPEIEAVPEYDQEPESASHSALENEPDPIEETEEESIPEVEEEIILDNLLEEENPGKETREPQLIEVPMPPEESSIKYTIQEQPVAAKPDSLLLKVFLVLLGLVIIGAIAYLLYPRPEEQKAELVDTSVDVAKTKRDSLTNLVRSRAVNDSIARADSSLQEKPTADTTQTVSKVATVPTKAGVVDTSTTFEIIGASVLNQKEANWFITQMRRNGVTAKVVRNIPGKRLKMSIATLKDEQSAKAERDRLEKKLAIKGIYIYRNKKG
jgi:nucleoid DNA-binding protein